MNTIIGTTTPLTVDVAVTEDADKSVVWSSSNPAVATVNSAGEVTALSEGGTIITATSTFDDTKSGSLGLTVSNVLRGAKVLYYVDFALGDDAALAALNAAAALYDTVVVETDGDNFVADLAAENPDLVVYLRQNNPEIPDDAEPVLLDWVNDGGAMVFGTYDFWNEDTEAQVAAMEAEFTGLQNFNSMEIQSPALSAGLTGTTVAVTDLDWSTYSVGLRAIGGGVELAHFYDNTPELTTNAALVSGHGGRTMVLGFLSDTVVGNDGTRLMRNIFEYVLLAALD